MGQPPARPFILEVSMVTVNQWENGEVNLTDEYFEPVFIFFGIFQMRLSHFVGLKTGTVLSRSFADVLEW
jgi:hypothetical protein